MTKRKRFYLHDVAACMGVEVSPSAHLVRVLGSGGARRA